ncbi:MAG: chromate transporter, partial [Phycisphaerales bacterium]
MPSARKATLPPVHPALEAFTVFLKLGLTSFGGPMVHLGNFHGEVVRRRGWMGEAEFADTVALCQ